MGKRHKPEEIITKLRQVDVLVSQGSSVADAIRSIGVTDVTYYRWRQGYGGLKSDQVKRMKHLETESLTQKPTAARNPDPSRLRDRDAADRARRPGDCRPRLAQGPCRQSLERAL